MENRYGLIKQGRSEEFREEDVWDLMNDDRRSGLRSFDEFHGENPLLSISRRLPSAARMIPGTQKHEEIHDQGECDDHGEKPKVMMHQHSAPVNIPDWSKIYGKSPRRKNSADATSSTQDDDDDDAQHDGYYDYDYDDDGDNDDDEDVMALPPHQWLARRLARSQISSFSVCEGAGRTLKGRDLSRVRDAVLSKTGFI